MGSANRGLITRAGSLLSVASERRRGLGESLRRSIAVRIIEGDVLAFEVPEIAQPVTEGVPLERVVDYAPR
jgi:hypothetical protein